MTKEQKEKEFLILCATTGAADFLYQQSSRPPRWMNKQEKDIWIEGYTNAKKSCQH